jgi:tRNA pseudouridine55 synthase
MLDGLIILDKPSGLTSARAVDLVKRLLPRGTKVGHAGTLDPFATGLLVLLVGRATRLCERIMELPKTYEATVRLGATTATDDPESPARPFAAGASGRSTAGVEIPSRTMIEESLRGFVGQIQQRPPVYSAIKLFGRRACDRARGGAAVQLEPRIVRVHSIDVLSYEWPLLKLRITCGRGTYIRAIARDVGEKLAVGGYLTELRRTRIGGFDVGDAARLDALTAQNLLAHLRDPDHP